MQVIATNASILDTYKASFQDRKANIVRVAANTGMVLALGGANISSVVGSRDDLWSGIAGMVGALLILGSLGAAFCLARGIGSVWFGLFLMLPGNLFTLLAGYIVAPACFLAMALIGDNLGLSIKQLGSLGIFLWFFTIYVGGLCVLFWPRRNGETGAAPLAAS
jgi:hypothetical protein